MMTFQSLTMDALCDRLAVKRNTLIVFHARPDGDAVGALSINITQQLCSLR